MSGILKALILSVAAAALFAAIAMTFIQAGALKEIVRFAAGLMITLALLSPISKLQLFPWQQLAIQNTETVDRHIEQAQQQRSTWMLQSATQEIEAYIAGRLRDHSITCEIQVDLSYEADEDTIVLQQVILSQLPEQADIPTIQGILEEECGIEKEKQSYVETEGF
ncbi:MAG: stage III sporulation protein AF [Butyricicoccus sp.]|nr:stage III sporulation protein AF [Butyricicoccus sp.]